MTPASLFGNPGPLRAWVTPLVPLTWLGDAHPAATSNPVRIGGYGAPDWARRWTVRALNVRTSLRPQLHKVIANLARQTVYCAIFVE
jgi:hypothetical protein